MTGGAGLRLGLDVVSGMSRYSRSDRKTNPGAENRRKQTCEHGGTLPPVTAHDARHPLVSRQGALGAIRPRMGLFHFPSRVTIPRRPIVQESVAIPTKSSF